MILTGTSPIDLSQMAMERCSHTGDDPQTLRRAGDVRYTAHGQGYIELVADQG